MGNIYLSLGGTWAAVIKYIFLAPELTYHPFFFSSPDAFNSHLLWQFIKLKRSHYRKEGNLRKIFSGGEPQFLPCFLPAATAQKGGRAADDNVCRSSGVWMGKGAGSRAPGLPFSLWRYSGQRVSGGTAEPCCRGGTHQPHTSVPGNTSSPDQAFRLPCLIARVPHCQPGRKKV